MDIMNRLLVVLVFLAAILHSAAAQTKPAEEAQALYRAFAAAQNMRDLEKVGNLLLDSPQFLWVSDGKSIWGREAVLKRMALFQEARIWHVEPELDKSVAVQVDDSAAYLHLPLELSLAFSDAAPERLHFLVSVLCVKSPVGWRIAALFTTTENPN
jgi:hypothetical protein